MALFSTIGKLLLSLVLYYFISDPFLALLLIILILHLSTTNELENLSSNIEKQQKLANGAAPGPTSRPGTSRYASRGNVSRSKSRARLNRSTSKVEGGLRGSLEAEEVGGGGMGGGDEGLVEEEDEYADEFLFGDSIAPEMNFTVTDVGSTHQQEVYPNWRAPLPMSNDYFEGFSVIKVRTDPQDPVFEPYFEGKRRLIELQFQGRFKQVPRGPLYMGVEVPLPPLSLGFVTKSMGNVVLALMKRLLPGLHHSLGGKGENPHIVFPILSALDSFIVTPEGEEPPPLGVAQLPASNDRQAYVDGKKKFEVGPWYSIGFHSMYLNLITWKIANVPGLKEIAMSSFWGTRPLRMIAYDIGSDTKSLHTAEEKRVYFCLEMKYHGGEVTWPQEEVRPPPRKPDFWYDVKGRKNPREQPTSISSSSSSSAGASSASLAASSPSHSGGLSASASPTVSSSKGTSVSFSSASSPRSVSPSTASFARSISPSSRAARLSSSRPSPPSSPTAHPTTATSPSSPASVSLSLPPTTKKSTSYSTPLSGSLSSPATPSPIPLRSPGALSAASPPASFSSASISSLPPSASSSNKNVRAGPSSPSPPQKPSEILDISIPTYILHGNQIYFVIQFTTVYWGGAGGEGREGLREVFSVLRTPDEVRRFGRAVKVGRFKVQNKSLKKSKRTREKRKEDVCNRLREAVGLEIVQPDKLFVPGGDSSSEEDTSDSLAGEVDPDAKRDYDSTSQSVTEGFHNFMKATVCDSTIFSTYPWTKGGFEIANQVGEVEVDGGVRESDGGEGGFTGVLARSTGEAQWIVNWAILKGGVLKCYDLSKKKDSKLSIAVSEITGVYAVGTGPRRLGDGLRSFAGYHFFKVEAGAQTTYFCVRTLLEAQSWVYLIKKLTGIEEEGDGEEDGIEEAGGELSLGEGEKGEKGEEPRLVVDQWGGGESSPGGKKRKSVSIRKILT